MEKTTEYVLGFLFADRYGLEGDHRVLLIEKKRPAWQAGKLNGVGGKIEPGETPLDAMIREFREEAGKEVKDWRQFCTFAGELKDGAGAFVVHCFTADAGRSFYGIHQMTDEALVPVFVDQLSMTHVAQELMPNLRWLIPMALGMDREPSVSKFSIMEVRSA